MPISSVSDSMITLFDFTWNIFCSLTLLKILIRSRNLFLNVIKIISWCFTKEDKKRERETEMIETAYPGSVSVRNVTDESHLNV